MDRTFARRASIWQQAGGILAIATAIGIWIAVVFAVAAPLGNALVRLGAPPTEALLACATPPDALASAASPSKEESCP
jgi:hypothetical protein